ncbi:LysR family transcriptional regulator [Burkholderia cenocepacia]|uniref:LysR family transcriptional regulator n=1 Tax=Burkholderia cenocepacia TaxID=95486 RepID=UPI0028572EDE|nr:LysR substrate-binding domain-containing protein [Burkholderia cenocepacia]MDR8105005.1 LysR family transcriptional regulator [Burkholderia cenocepacia]
MSEPIRSDLKLHQLECLVAVSDTGSMRRAADQLGRSATAVSNALRELEQTVGAVLLERRADGVFMTTAGAALLAHARLVFRQLQLASDDVAQMRLGGGTLRIGVTPWLIHGVLPSAVAAFRQSRPDVQLDIAEHLGGDYSVVRNGVLDFAFGPLPDEQTDRALEVRPLYRYSFAIVCRPGHPAANAQSLDDLAGYDWLLSRSIDRVAPAVRPLIEATAPQQVCHLHFARSLHVALALVRSTDMLAVVPWPLIETPDMRDRYVALHVGTPTHESTSCLVTRRYEPLSGPALAFIQTFERIAREQSMSTDPGTRRIFNMVDAESPSSTVPPD